MTGKIFRFARISKGGCLLQLGEGGSRKFEPVNPQEFF